MIALIVAALAAGILVFGIRSRVKAEANLRTVTQQLAVPSVSVVSPKHTAPVRRSCSSRQHTAIYILTNLCPYGRLFEGSGIST